MFKAYNKFNIFEKKFFWLNNLGIVLMMVGSVTAGISPIPYEFKIKIIISLMMSYAIGGTLLWNTLEKLETQWKGNTKEVEVIT